VNNSPVTVARETAPDFHRLPYSACDTGHPISTIVRVEPVSIIADAFSKRKKIARLSSTMLALKKEAA
jgi:hypothetical protein